jgi:peroxiredoxin
MRSVWIAILLWAAAGAAAQTPLQAPDLTLQDTSGASQSLASYRGKIVILNFWATWCLPCKDEMPIFVDVANRYGDRGLAVLAASLDDDRTRKFIPQFARSHKMKFPILAGADAQTMKQFGLQEIAPSTVFIDRDGTIVFRIIGEARRNDVLDRVQWLVGAREGERPAAVVDRSKKR